MPEPRSFSPASNSLQTLAGRNAWKTIVQVPKMVGHGQEIHRPRWVMTSEHPRPGPAGRSALSTQKKPHGLMARRGNLPSRGSGNDESNRPGHGIL